MSAVLKLCQCGNERPCRLMGHADEFNETQGAVHRPVKPVTFPGLQALCGEQVLIRPLPPPKQRRSGLWIPDNAQQNKQSYEGALNGRVFEGIVQACGPGKYDADGVLIPVDVVPGDHVRFYFFADYYLRWPTDEYLIVPASSIQAIVSPEGITPLGNRVLVQRIDVADKGVILAPEIAKKTSVIARVLAVGSGSRLPMTVREGQRVIFSAHSGTAIEWESQELLILKEPEIYGVLED